MALLSPPRAGRRSQAAFGVGRAEAVFGLGSGRDLSPTSHEHSPPPPALDGSALVGEDGPRGDRERAGTDERTMEGRRSPPCVRPRGIPLRLRRRSRADRPRCARLRGGPRVVRGRHPARVVAGRGGRVGRGGSADDLVPLEQPMKREVPPGSIEERPEQVGCPASLAATQLSAGARNGWNPSARRRLQNRGEERVALARGKRRGGAPIQGTPVCSCFGAPWPIQSPCGAAPGFFSAR